MLSGFGFRVSDFGSGDWISGLGLDPEEEGPDCHHAANRATELGFNRLLLQDAGLPKPETRNHAPETRQPRYRA